MAQNTTHQEASMSKLQQLIQHAAHADHSTWLASAQVASTVEYQVYAEHPPSVRGTPQGLKGGEVMPATVQFDPEAMGRLMQLIDNLDKATQSLNDEDVAYAEIHLRKALKDYGKRPRGFAGKAYDAWANPTKEALQAMKEMTTQLTSQKRFGRLRVAKDRTKRARRATGWPM